MAGAILIIVFGFRTRRYHLKDELSSDDGADCTCTQRIAPEDVLLHHSSVSATITGRATPAFNTFPSSPGILTRPMSAVESAFASILAKTSLLGKDHLAVSLALKLSLPSSVADPVPHLRTAWAVVRKLHPHLGSILSDVPVDSSSSAGDGDYHSQHIIIPVFDPEGWLNRTFHVETDAKCGNDLFESAGVERHASCTWISSSCELFLHTSHWRCDGSSMLTIAGDVLSVLSQSVANGEGPGATLDSFTGTSGDGSIAPSIDWIADGFIEEASMPPYAKAAADSLLQQMMAGAPSVALPVAEGRSLAAPGNSTRAVVKFTPEETRHLLARCKEREVTLTVATHAALILCAARYPQHPMCRSYSSAFPVDLRSILPEPYSKPAYSVGLLYCGLPLSVLNVVVDEMSFVQVCDELAAFYKRDRQDWCRDDEGEAVSVARLAAPWIRRNLAAVTANVPPGRPGVRALDFSSLGLIDKKLPREHLIEKSGAGEIVAVEDFWLATQVVAKPVQCHSWTFRDEYRLQATWNQSYYEASFVELFLDEAKTELLKGFGFG